MMSLTTQELADLRQAASLDPSLSPYHAAAVTSAQGILTHAGVPVPTRHEYDARQALIPGSWQNRQGREHEWHAASARDSAFGWTVTAVGVVAFAAVVGAVLAQVWRA